MASRGPALVLMLALAVIAPGAGLRAQGCSQCRDTVSQTSAEQQQSYRTAIGIMLVATMSLAGAGVVAIRRFGR